MPEGGEVLATLRNMTKTGHESGKFSGCRLAADKTEFGFFVFRSQIYVFVEDKVFPLSGVAISNEIQEKRHLFSRQKRLLKILHDSQELISTQYRMQKKYDTNPLWPTEEEDVDHYLWISAVLNDPERVDVIIEEYSEAERIRA